LGAIIFQQSEDEKQDEENGAQWLEQAPRQGTGRRSETRDTGEKAQREEGFGQFAHNG
jgi:hypothetical protein